MERILHKSILGLDLQKSMPIFQEASQGLIPLLNDQNYDWKASLRLSAPRLDQSKPAFTARNHRRWLGVTALFLFLIMSFTKIAIFSTGDFVSLFKWQFFSSLLLTLFCLGFAGVILVKSFLKILAAECKSKP
jgi:hypothetical protein